MGGPCSDPTNAGPASYVNAGTSPPEAGRPSKTLQQVFSRSLLRTHVNTKNLNNKAR